MPLSPYSGYLTLAFLVAVVVLMFFDKVQGPYLIGATVIGVPALVAGWFAVRHRVRAAAQDSAVPTAPAQGSSMS
jgi:L-asparagine permease